MPFTVTNTINTINQLPDFANTTEELTWPLEYLTQGHFTNTANELVLNDIPILYQYTLLYKRIYVAWVYLENTCYCLLLDLEEDNAKN